MSEQEPPAGPPAQGWPPVPEAAPTAPPPPGWPPAPPAPHAYPAATQAHPAPPQAYPPAPPAYPPAPPAPTQPYPGAPPQYYPQHPDPRFAPSAFAAPYAVTPPADLPAPPFAPRSAILGIVALIVAIVAVVGAGITGAVAAFRIGLGAGRELAMHPPGADFDLSVLSPVREWVLLGEVAFWIGTVLGVWALVQGIVAIVTRRGRGAAIAAVIVAALGIVVFGIVVDAFISAGWAAGSGIGG